MPYDELTKFLNWASGGPDWLREAGFIDQAYLFPLLRWLDHGKMNRGLEARIRTLPQEQQGDLKRWKRDRISPKLRRWIYQNITADHWKDDHSTNRDLLFGMAVSNRQAPWRNGFFWNEINRMKGSCFGMYVVEAMSPVSTYDDSRKLIDHYHDESAHPLVRGEAIFGLYYATHHRDQYPPPKSQKWKSITQVTCLEALTDQANPYAQAGGCFLSEWIGGFEEQLKKLALEDTEIDGEDSGMGRHPVSMYAKHALEPWNAGVSIESSV